MRDLVARVVLRSKDLASKPIRGFQRRMTSLRGVIASVTAAITTMVTGTAIARFFKGAVDESASFEDQMAKVEAVTGATAEEMDRLRAAAVEMGETTTFNANQAGQALETLSRAGLDTEQSLSALPEVLALARGNSIELAKAASLVTQASKGMNIGFEESARVADVLTATAQNANTTVTGLGQAMSQAAPTANSLGLSLEETTALIGRLADAGIDASRAGTALNAIFSQFQETGGRFREALADVGITTDNFREALAQLEAKGDDASEAIIAVGREAGPALRALLSQGTDSINGLTRTLENSDGAAQDAADTMDNTLNAAIERLASVWRTFKRALGDRVLPDARKAVEDLAEGVRNFINSADFDKFAASFRETFRNATDAIRQFLRELDPGEATRKAGNLLARVSEQFQNAGAAARLFGNSIATVWNGVQTVVSAVVGEVMQALTNLSKGYSWVIQAGNKAGAVSDEYTKKVQTHVGAMQAATDAIRENTRVQAGEFMDSLKGASSAYQDLNFQTDENTNKTDDNTGSKQDNAKATEKQKQRLWELSGAVEETRNATASANEQTDQATQKAGENQKSVSQLRQEYQRLKESGTASAQEMAAKLKEIDAANQGAAESSKRLADEATQGQNEAGEAAERSGEKTKRSMDKAAEATSNVADEADNVGEAATSAAQKMRNAFGSAFGQVMTQARTRVSELSTAARNLFEQKIGGNQFIQQTQSASEALEEARRRTDELVSAGQNLRNRSFAAWMNDTATASAEVAEKYWKQRVELEKLTDEVRAGQYSYQGLANLTDQARQRMDALDDADLENLESAIDNARRRMESLRDESQSTLQSLNDELLQLQGREDELAKRRRERERQEIQADLEQAEALGDEKSVQNLQKALNTLDKIAQEEQEQRRSEREQRQREQRQSRQSQQQAPAPSKTVRVDLNGAQADIPEDQADGFLGELERAGMRSQ